MTPEEFTALYERYQRPVLALCYRVLGDGDLAGDIAQDVWLQAWERRSRYRDEGKSGAYLFTLAYSRSIDAARRRGRVWQRTATMPVWHPDRRSLDEQHLRETLADLAPHLAALPSERQRAAIGLAMAGMPYKVAAAALGLDINAYRALLHRARANLRAGMLAER